jgi:hypothetical protein
MTNAKEFCTTKKGNTLLWFFCGLMGPKNWRSCKRKNAEL